MARTRCDVRFNDRPARGAAWTDRGIDAAEFYVSPNPGEDLRPLARIASGGELSRIMLALKTLALDRDAPGKTLIFDEVDAGIGGPGGRRRRRQAAARSASAFQVLVHHAPAADRRAAAARTSRSRSASTAAGR